MSLDDFIKWLISSSGAGWVFGILSFLGLLWSRKNQKRPNRLLCLEAVRHSMIDLNKLRDRDIKVTYDNQPVNTLEWTSIDMINTGSDLITDATVQLIFPDEVKVLKAVCWGEPNNIAPRSSIANNTTSVTIPFLNPFPEHKNKVSVFLVVDGTSNGIKITGGGHNWSTTFQNIAEQKRNALKKAFLFPALGLLVMLCYPLIVYICPSLRIDKLQDVNAKSTILLICFLLALAGIVYKGKKALDKFVLFDILSREG